jgi:hypothetical protein
MHLFNEVMHHRSLLQAWVLKIKREYEWDDDMQPLNDDEGTGENNGHPGGGLDV